MRKVCIDKKGDKMSRKFAKIVAIVIALAMVITTVAFSIMAPLAFADSTEITDMEAVDEYLQFLNRYYKDEVSRKKLVQGAMKGITDALEDPYSEYFAKVEEKNSFEETVSGEYSGIGVTMEQKDGNNQIVKVNEEGPAKAAGLQVGDIIVKVDGKNTAGIPLSELVSLLRGKRGTHVKVGVLRNGKSLEMDVERAVIAVSNISYEMKNGSIGYIRISGFDADISMEYKKAKTALINKGAKAMILDLRDNPGGYIDGAIGIAGQILPQGKEISKLYSRGKLIKTEKVEGSGGEYALPMAVLVNKDTASASEILAGALQDHNAAYVVGSTTYGKGVAQQVIDLSSGDSAKISVFYFKTPLDKDINGVGIKPDYFVENLGAADEGLKAKLKELAPMEEPVKNTVGSKGLNVFGAQQRLQILGYYKGVLSGTFDKNTADALVKFQRESGLYPYPVLDNSTKKSLDMHVYNKAYGINSDKDLQLEKAMNVLSGKIK